MDYTCKTRTLQALNKDMHKNVLVLEHKLQRSEGQWNKNQKSDLIDSLLRKYPINPTYSVIQEDGTMAVIDGVQRLSTIRDFLDNKFSLAKNMENIIINGEEKNLSGLKFNKLDEDVQSELLNSELQIYKISDYTDKDIRELFRRQNSGKPLSSKLVRVVHESDKFSDVVYALSSHPFMKKIMTSTQRKNGTDRDIIIQTFMLMSSNQEHEFLSFRAKDIDDYVINFADQHLDKADILSKALDVFNEELDNIKLPVTSVPQILYSGYHVIKDRKSFPALIEKITDFVNNYDTNEEYKQFVQSGTVNTENVKGRFDFWRNILREL